MKPRVWTVRALGKRALKKLINIYRERGLFGIWQGLRELSTATGLGFFGYDRNDYEKWVLLYDNLTDKKRNAIRDRLNQFVETPLISVVVPVCNPKLGWLKDTVESVLKQFYPHWELIIVDRGSTDEAVRQALGSLSEVDSRVRIVLCESDGAISTACNRALEMATGKWVALLGPDDLLSEQALFWVANAIQNNPEALFIYSDEDKIDEIGIRFDPYFKCEWNVDLFYSQNLVSNLGVFRSDLLREVGGFSEKKELEGALSYDLILRVVERVETAQIEHIPRVLYHRRVLPGHDRHAIDSSESGKMSRVVALNDYLQRNEIDATAENVGVGCRVRYALPSELPMVSLIIPTRNGLRLIRQCIDSILEKTSYLNYEILIVDNNSDEPSLLEYLEELKKRTNIRIVRDNRPFNYSQLNNAAAILARGEILGLLNNDLEVISPDWLSEMVSIALQPQVGAVGGRLWYPDDTLQHGGVVLVGGVAGHSHKHLPRGLGGYYGRAVLMQSFSAVTGACLIVRKSIYEDFGGLNESELGIAFNDVDFCLRLREAGYRNVWTPYAEMFHHESATRGYEDTPEKVLRFEKEIQYMKQRWGNILRNDPAYSPNLTFNHEDFSLAWPPRVKCEIFDDRHPE